MAPNRKLYSIAVVAAEKIRKFWRTYKDAHLYHQPTVDIHPGTYEIVSNIKNGFPPRR
jgi:hypothetical protein